MYRRVLVLLLVLDCAGLVPLAGWAQESAPLPAAGQTAAQASPDRRVCRRVQVTGSRVKERVCRTQRDWDRLTEESRETVDKAREGGNVVTGES